MLINKLIRYETVTPTWLKIQWEIHFEPGSTPGRATVREVIRAPLGRIGRTLLRAFGKNPALEVPANLHRLKQLMETGAITDLSHSVPGKFIPNPPSTTEDTWREQDARTVDPEIAALRAALREGWLFNE